MSTLPISAAQYQTADAFRQLPWPNASSARLADVGDNWNGDARVVGGAVASVANWPSFARVQALLGNGRALNCGGAVIARQWILTAAHCVINQPAKALRIYEGRNNLLAGGAPTGVDRIVTHPNFFVDSHEGQHYDVALLHLTSSAQSPPQRLISRQRMATAVTAGAMAEVAGYGLTLPQTAGHPLVGGVSGQLREATLPIYDHSACGARLAEKTRGDADELIDDTEICAGDPVRYGADSCAGDSGGPLAMYVDGVRTEVGIVSWGAGCAQRGMVGVYASVGYFQSWIASYVPEADFGSARSEPAGASVAKGRDCGAPDASMSFAMSLDIIEGDSLRTGSTLHFRATPSVDGQLVVVNVDLSTCRTFQIFPNLYTAAGAGAWVRAGQPLNAPKPDDGYRIEVNPPSGPNRLLAFVVPAGLPINDIAGPSRGMTALGDVRAVVGALRERALTNQTKIEAFGVVDYSITP